MKKYYIWYGIIVITLATIINYSTVSSNRSYSSGTFSTSRSSGGWHK